jgi:hypothetical protein
LVEAYARNPYGRRVRVTYDFLVHALEVVKRGPEELVRAVQKADAECVATRGGGRDGRVPLTFEHAEKSRPFVYRGYELNLHASDITGDEVIEYGPQPVDLEIPLFDESRATSWVVPPAAYVIPPQWTDVIERLELHGVRLFRLRSGYALEVDGYRFAEVTFADRPHEGRQMPRYRTEATQGRRFFVAGTVVVPLDQPRAKLAVNLLEPTGPDSFVGWGFFNTVFEQKEYAEAYVMEPLARQMLIDDAALRREFETRLARDAEFAKDPRQRLDFFYRRSPYADTQLNVYPVGRLEDAGVVARLRGEAK